MLRRLLIAATLAAALAPVLAAQVIDNRNPPRPAPKEPSPPTPRWPDGHPNLGSTADHKGYWEVRPGLGGTPRAADIPFQPWAQALTRYRQSRQDLFPPSVRCKPNGGPSFFNAPGFEITEVPEMKRVYLLGIAGAHSWREIFIDGRSHPPADRLRPTFFGHSIGKWEGDTLVIDTVGYNEKQWIVGSYPTTKQLHTIERISRPNLKTLVYEATIDDPGAYTKPWSLKWSITETTASSWIEGGEVFEYICQDDGAAAEGRY